MGSANAAGWVRSGEKCGVLVRVPQLVSLMTATPRTGHEPRNRCLGQTGPGAHPASYTMGTGSFPGERRLGRGVDHPPTSSAEVKERVELYSLNITQPTNALIVCHLLFKSLF